MTRDDEQARQERAARLREEIEARKRGAPSETPPQSPREFVEREAARREAQEEEDGGEEDA
jgi:hypothetical protein